jgi:hypothetical protein
MSKRFPGSVVLQQNSEGVSLPLKMMCFLYVKGLTSVSALHWTIAISVYLWFHPQLFPDWRLATSRDHMPTWWASPCWQRDCPQGRLLRGDDVPSVDLRNTKGSWDIWRCSPWLQQYSDSKLIKISWFGHIWASCSNFSRCLGVSNSPKHLHPKRLSLDAFNVQQSQGQYDLSIIRLTESMISSNKEHPGSRTSPPKVFVNLCFSPCPSSRPLHYNLRIVQVVEPPEVTALASVIVNFIAALYFRVCCSCQHCPQVPCLWELRNRYVLRTPTRLCPIHNLKTYQPSSHKQ